jgi:tRNA A-37 threonylcarbamoyl transferase component Bud32
MWKRALLLLLCGWSLVALLGCGGDGAIEIRSWTLTIAGSDEARHVTLPAHLDVPARKTTYALRARVPLPDAMRGKDLTLAVPYLPARSQLTIDGAPMTNLDEGDADVDTYRTAGQQRWRIPASVASRGAGLTLDLEVEHSWTQSAWFDSTPRLSATPRGDPGFVRTRAFDRTSGIFGFTTILFVAFSYAMIVMFARKRTAARWFVLEAVAGSLYPAFTMGITQRVFGTRDGAVMAVGLSIAAYASLRFAHEHCKLPSPPKVWTLALAVSVATTAAASGPFHLTPVAAPIVVSAMVANAVYQYRLFLRMRREGQPTHVWLVPLAWPLANVVACTDFASWLGLGAAFGGVRAGALGIGIVSLVQSCALGREYILSMDRGDDLNAQLAARVAALEDKNAEVQLLNDELRRQVGARAEQLAVVLARIGAAEETRLELAPGSVVEGRYLVVRRIGAGAAGAVYEVERTTDRRRLALKVLRTRATTTELARFAREAQIASQIDHPNVVAVIDVDVSSSGYLYIVMELADGASLRQRRARFGDVEWAVEALAQIAAGLEAIHAIGIVHRDLKPENVVVASAEDAPLLVKIADFGIAMLKGDAADAGASADQPFDATLKLSTDDGALTGVGLILGTPHYMAPELLRGASFASTASDVFGLGVIAYELLAGALPVGREPLCVILHGDAEAAPSFAAVGTFLSPSLLEMLDRCLSLDPARRPTTRELHAALVAARARDRVAAE